jgi:serine/threonine-protein kinase
VSAFLATRRAAGLFAPMQLARVEAIATTAAAPGDAARALVDAGFLTQFQAERLLAGKTEGYHLGPYVVLEQIGRSAMGRVYKGRHRTMNRPVAVKVLSAELTRTAAARQEFQQQIRAAAQLNHPNIVAAYDANEFASRFYTVVEFVDGPNFETLMIERGPLAVAEACALAAQVAAGLAHAHHRGLTHGDIKPRNLMVARPSKSAPEPVVKIADFGVAKLSSSRSPDFLSPELAHRPATADHRADLYSLGAVLYFLLAGRPPFHAGTRDEKIRRHLFSDPVRIESLRPDLPPVLTALIHRMLAKYPEERPASAAEVQECLRAFAASDAIHDLPAAAPGPPPLVVGPLSNTQPFPPERVLPSAATTETFPLPTPGPTPSPWEAITEESAATFPGTALQPSIAARRRSNRGLSALTWTLLASSLLFLVLFAVGVAMRVLGK